MGGRARLLPAGLLALALGAQGGGTAQSPAASTGAASEALSRSAHAREVARRIMASARYCTLVTLGDDHRPQARIVDPLGPDDSFAIYIATNPRSRKVGEIRRDPRVTLLYFDTAKLGYVTALGEAREVDEDAKRSHHKSDWQPFFPREKPAAYILYRVAVQRLEVVSAKDGLPGDPTTWRPEIVELK